MTDSTNPIENKTYEFRIRILGNEIISVGFTTSNDSNRFFVAALISVFSFLTILGAYSEKLIAIYHSLIK